jgi:predicted Fe-Mo cluster-binding NifX family protein
MKIALSSDSPYIEGNVNQRFGRCPYFIIFNLDNEEWEALPNPGAKASGGAGVQAAQLVANSGATAIISGGHFGPSAHSALEAGGVEMLSSGTIPLKEAIAKFKAGELKAGELGPDRHSH